jgi:hypothetical protein
MTYTLRYDHYLEQFNLPESYHHMGYETRNKTGKVMIRALLTFRENITT